MTAMAKLCCLLALLAASPALGRPRGLRALFAGDAADARSADIMGSMSAVVSDYFVEPAPGFAHRARTFRVDTLPETDELVKPFVGSTFRYPFVKVQLDGGETTKNYDRSVTTAEDALQMLGCDDIAAEPEKIEKRCRTQERVGVDATGREVRASIACKGVCRESCEGC